MKTNFSVKKKKRVVWKSEIGTKTRRTRSTSTEYEVVVLHFQAPVLS